jgi:hypothetical protein
MPASVVENGSPEHSWIINDGISSIGDESAKNLAIICYLCRSKTLINMVALQPDERDQDVEHEYIFVLPAFLHCTADDVSWFQLGMSKRRLRRY